MLRFKQNGKAPPAKGMLWASQVAPGNENGAEAARLRHQGRAGMAQEDPNYLWYTPFGEPKRLITRGGAGAVTPPARMTRIPPGHPEGYLEGFANIYSEAAAAIRAMRAQGRQTAEGRALPDRRTTALPGMRFIDACVKSSKKNAAWTRL